MIAEESVVMGVAVLDIAKERVSDSVEVATDLVPAARHGMDFDERVTRGRVLGADRVRELDLSEGLVMGLSVDGIGEALDFERKVDTAFMFDVAARDREVGLVHFAVREESAQFASRGFCHREQNQAARGCIQSVNRENLTLEQGTQVIETNFFFGRRICRELRWMDEKTSGLVDNEKVRVLINDSHFFGYGLEAMERGNGASSENQTISLGWTW